MQSTNETVPAAVEQQQTHQLEPSDAARNAAFDEFATYYGKQRDLGTCLNYALDAAYAIDRPRAGGDPDS